MNQRIRNDKYPYKPYEENKNVKNKIEKTPCQPKKFLWRSMVVNGNKIETNIVNYTNPVIRKIKNYRPRSEMGVDFLAKGQQGKVEIGCIDKNCKKLIAIKTTLDENENKNAEVEFNIMKKLSTFKKASPHLVYPLYLAKCNNKVKIYSEYFAGGSLESWRKKHRNRLTEFHWMCIIFQVLYTLHTIRSREESFRHNDLHMGNVLIDDEFNASGYIEYLMNGKKYFVPNIGVNTAISDFGFSYMDGPGLKTQNATSGEFRRNYGIFVGNSAKYDYHLFLNSLWHTRRSLPSNITAFIESILPVGYRGTNNTFVSNDRLRYDKDHSALPPLVNVLKHPMFRMFENPPTGRPRVNKFVNKEGKVKTFSKSNLMAIKPSQNRQQNLRTSLQRYGIAKTPPRTERQIQKNVDMYILDKDFTNMRFGDIVNAVTKPGENRARIRPVIEKHVLGLIKKRKTYNGAIAVLPYWSRYLQSKISLNKYLQQQAIPKKVRDEIVAVLS